MPLPHWASNCLKSFRSWFAQLYGTSRIGVFALALSILIAAIEFLTHLKDAREFMATALLLGLKIEPATSKVELQGWLFFVVSLWIFLSCTFFLLWIRAELRGNNDHTIRTLRGVMRAAGHICRRMFPKDHASDHTMEKAHFVYQIHRDFTAQVRRTFRVRAGKQPVYFIERGFGVRDHADPAETFIDIDFQVRDTNDPNGVVYLPMVNERKNKSACIFFLPRIEPGNTRTFEVSYRWPGMVRALKVEGEEEFTFRQKSAQDMSEFCMELYLEPESGGNLTWEECGDPVNNQTIAASVSQLNWPGVTYSGSNLTPDSLNTGVGLRLRWRSN